jgi:hypothetical protein
MTNETPHEDHEEAGPEDDDEQRIRHQSDGFTQNLPGGARSDDREERVRSGNVDQAAPYEGSIAPDFAFDIDEGV